MAAAVAAVQQYEQTSSDQPKPKIILLEKKDKVGRKLYATGNGRCNLSNLSCPEKEQTLVFFSRIGIDVITDDAGRIYPASESAADVVYALECRLRSSGVEILTETAVTEVKQTANGFLIRGKRNSSAENKANTLEIRSKKVILATGGKAGPQYGSEGDGYKIARALGHQIAPIYPVLTPIESKDVTAELAGVRVKGEAELLFHSDVEAISRGEIQFNKGVLSGICIMDLSRALTLREGRTFEDYTVRIRPAGNWSRDILASRRSLPGFRAGDLLLSLVKKEFAAFIFDQLQIDRKKSAAELSDVEIDKIASCLDGVPFRVSGAKGWKYAQCTGGGVPIDELLPTMESCIAAGLYITGETTDYDGACGGFNLDYAWNSGIKAGRGAMQAVLDQHS